jgi:uncharacterized protein YxjI
MHPSFQHNQYRITNQIFALLGQLRIYGPDGEVVLYAEQEMVGVCADFRLCADEQKTQELLIIKPRHANQFSELYDILDAPGGQILGSCGRRGVKSVAGDEWVLLDAAGEILASCAEAQTNAAMLRRLLLGNLIPRRYSLQAGDSHAASLKQRFNLMRYETDLEIAANRLDPRLILGLAALLAILAVWQDCGCRASPG